MLVYEQNGEMAGDYMKINKFEIYMTVGFQRVGH